MAAGSSLVPIERLYAFIADGERGALIDPSGGIAWMCIPSWDGDAVFASLLGGRGIYRISPIGSYVWGGFYEAGTLIWRNRWIMTGGALLECHDALAFPGNPKKALLLRRIVPLKGETKISIMLDLRPAYGRKRIRDWRLSDEGVWTGSLAGLHAFFRGAAEARFQKDKGLVLARTVKAGEKHDLLLELSVEPPGEPAPDADSLWKSTRRAWDLFRPDLEECAGPRDALHAYMVLRGLTTESGGMAAAATTSLPERGDSGRNYDYRYVWVRDQCWTGQAIAAVKPDVLLHTAVRFIRDRLLDDGPGLRPVYTHTGAKVPREKELKHLPGYPGGVVIKIGNRAGEQFQLDVFGEALLLFAAAAGRDCLDADGWRAAEVAVRAIGQRWKEKDAGIWEIGQSHWTHSRLICAAGLKRIAMAGAPRQAAPKWLALAEAIMADTAAQAVHRSGYWMRSPQDDRVDASLLLPILRGALDVKDPRSISTIEKIHRDLTRDGYCYRFRSSLPLSDAEGAFTICGFWLCLMHLQHGRRLEAARWFERTRGSCGPPGLYAEEYDVIQRELRGNLPQAFVHAALLECAARIGREIGNI